MNTENHAEQQARTHWDTILELETAAGADWDRFDDLRDMRDMYPEDMTGSDLEELEGLTAQTAGFQNREESEERIQEYPLSVEFRSDWVTPGDKLTASEFRILLCTGGPAVQIRGELDEYRQPCRAWIEYQDWGTPWIQFFDADQNTLIDFCNRFYFGA